jgi:hypothetical protein
MLSAQPNEAHTDADTDAASIISEATNAFQMARRLQRSVPTFRPRLEPIVSQSPDLEAITPINDETIIDETINKFIDEALAISEKTKLYSRGHDVAPNLGDLVQISKEAQNLRQKIRPSDARVGASLLALELPAMEPFRDSLPNSLFSSLSEGTGDTSVSQSWAPPTQSAVVHREMPKPSNPIPADSIRSTRPFDTRQHGMEIFSLRSLSVAGSSVDIGMSAKENLNLTGWAAIFVPGQFDTRGLRCNLEITTSEGSICLWAIATTQRRSNSFQLSPSSPAALTPHALLPSLPLESTSPTDRPPQNAELPRTFRHFFTHDSRPFPNVLHPSVEGPEERCAPYAFSFRENQFVAEEGSSDGGKWITGLRYAFEQQADRDFVREKIFGKTLLVSAGTEKISFSTYVAGRQQNISLWEDLSNQIKTIAFFRSLANGKSLPVADVEYQVLRFEDANRARRPGSKLALVVKPYNTFPKLASPISPTISTSPTSRSSNFFSRQSTRRSSCSSERESGSEEMVCTLEFSDLKDRNLKDSRDKKRFMEHLQQ